MNTTPNLDDLIENTAHKNPNTIANTLRASTLGINDGVVSMAAFLVAILSTSTTPTQTLTSGIALLAGGAISMGIGEYTSVSAAKDLEQQKKEQIEGEYNPTQAAIHSILSFTIGGTIPLATYTTAAHYITTKTPDATPTFLFITILLSSLTTLLIAGATQAKLSGIQEILKPTTRLLIAGTIGIAIASTIGKTIETALNALGLQ